MLKLMPDNDETTVSKALKAALIGIETLKGNSFNHLPLIDFQHLKGTEPNDYSLFFTRGANFGRTLFKYPERGQLINPLI